MSELDYDRWRIVEDLARECTGMTSDSACYVCGANELVAVEKFERLPRVTSDCKPFPAGGKLAVCHRCGAVQKPADADWRKDTALIYKNYDIYFQSKGVEQSVFDSVRGVRRLRSQVMLDHVHRVRSLGAAGAVLDVGCGKGTFLQAFSEFRPNWRLYGHELSRKNEDTLAQIPMFESLYTGPFADLPGGFDVISLIHTLEHLEKPIEGLQELAPKLAPEGILIVEVPNADATPFDLLVADHASHFTGVDLANLSKRAGLAPLVVADDWMTKELSLVAARGGVSSISTDPPSAAVVHAAVIRRLEWLNTLLDDAGKTAQRASKFGLFGTSVAGMWLYGMLGDKVDFFVDEDPGRLGSLHGRPVIPPDRIPKHATVYLTLIPEVAHAVAARIARDDITLKLPPPVSW